MNAIKRLLRQDPGYSIFRFLTVDAYLAAVPFYEKNGFKRLLPAEGRDGTQAMYFDMKSLSRP